MDINKLLKNVNNLDDYIDFTEKIADKCKKTKVQLNITTVLALKKIRPLEIEYLNKSYENGAACIILERLLSLPPSKTWGVLGKEVVSLLQYWLEAIRKYLLNHSVHWWSFLKLILKFIKEIHLKDPTMPNILVELTAECLLDIASRDSPDAYQRHEILHCLNAYCADSSREIRFALKNKFGEYFTKLAFHVATSSYLPCQYSALEALVRWLVPRHERALRAAAAQRWFPEHLCVAAARDIFLKTSWMNFFQDARNFLNALNEGNGLVTSVVCRRLTIGKILIISGTEKQQTWLDINSSGKSISILLDPRMLQTFGALDQRACEALVVAEHDARAAQLFSRSRELTLSLHTLRPPRVRPAHVAAGAASDVTCVLSSRVNLRKLDAALRAVFGDKYHLLMALDTELSLSPPRSRDTRMNQNSSEEDSRFSHPVEAKSRKRSGYMVKSVTAGELVSPSTASTSSLAQLHEKLAALPRFRYDKEDVRVCAQPQLSSVTEISETDKSFRSILFRSHGVCYKTFKPRPVSLSKSSIKKAESDTETTNHRSNLRRRLSPTERDEISASCLLVATVGSADDSVISNTIERLSKSKELKNDNIVDLLVQEALQAKPAVRKEKVINSDINTGEYNNREVKENSEAIENTPIQEEFKETKNNKVTRKKKFTIVSKSTTDDESNTEVINETSSAFSIKKPMKSKINRKQSVLEVTESKVADKQGVNLKTVEEFFSQHFSETKPEDRMISPSLAKKINETSSESSENFDAQLLITNKELNANVEQLTFSDIEIIECLNDIVDKVCSDFEKCTEYFTKDVDVVQRNNDANVSTELTDTVSKPKRSIKITYKSRKEKKTREIAKKKKNKTEQKPIKKMSTIIEQKDEGIVEDNPPKDIIEDIEIARISSPVREENGTPGPKNNLETTLIKRKRKLYSPKDEREIEKGRKGTKVSDTEDDVALSEFKSYKIMKAPETTASCYKEIEKERQKHFRLLRSRKSRGKVEESISPKTLKMNSIFDKLKTTVNSDENIIFADKKTIQADVYNFTSDSDDEDFKKKKIEIQKRTNTSTIGSFESKMSTRVLRQKTRPKYSEKSSDENKKPKVVRKKKAVKTRSSKSKVNVNIEPVIDMIDEKMRETIPEDLSSSIVVEKPREKNRSDVKLMLHEPPEMELITDDQEAAAPEKMKRHKKTKKTETLSLKKEKDLKKNVLELISDQEDDRTVSPLPGLVVESMPTRKDDANGSVTVAMLQKFKKIYQDGPDTINESSNTQNMLLSDNERGNYSLQNVSVNNTDEICFADYNQENLQTGIETDSPKKNNKKPDQQLKSNTIKNKTKTEKTNTSKDLCCEVVEISEFSDVKSENSIVTDGITAHGDFNEAPPSPGMLRKSMHPREIEDLDESMKDYFVKLNWEINKSISKESHEGKSAEGAEGSKIVFPAEEASLSINSPLVSVERLSYDDIRKWLPSERSNESDSSVNSSSNKREATQFEKVSKVRNIEKTKPEDVIPNERATKCTTKIKRDQQLKQLKVYSPKAKSPTDPIIPLSYEEFKKWLPMPSTVTFEDKAAKHNTSGFEDKAETTVSSSQNETRQSKLKLVYNNTRQKSKAMKDINISDIETNELNAKGLKPQIKSIQPAIKGKNKAIESHYTTSEDSDIISNKVKAFSKRQTKHISTAKKNKGQIINTIDSDSEQATAKNKRSSARRNTAISSSEYFEDFGTNIQTRDESDEDLGVKKNRDMSSKERLSYKTIHQNNLGKFIDEQRSGSALTKIKNKTQCQNSSPTMRPRESISAKATEIETLDSISTKAVVFKRPIKRNSSPDFVDRLMGRKSPPVLSETKKMRFEANEDALAMESAISSSSVNDWFKRTAPTRSLANDTSLFRDTMENVLEKLDTTLVEVNQNTSKKFLNLFMEVQKQLTTRQEERRELYKSVATGIITEMVSILDDKFVDLEKRSHEMDTAFKEQLKKQAYDLIREDCEQKRAMVVLLKEDVQAVIDHMERNRTESP